MTHCPLILLDLWWSGVLDLWWSGVLVTSGRESLAQDDDDGGSPPSFGFLSSSLFFTFIAIEFFFVIFINIHFFIFSDPSVFSNSFNSFI